MLGARIGRYRPCCEREARDDGTKRHKILDFHTFKIIDINYATRIPDATRLFICSMPARCPDIANI